MYKLIKSYTIFTYRVPTYVHASRKHQSCQLDQQIQICPKRATHILDEIQCIIKPTKTIFKCSADSP